MAMNTHELISNGNMVILTSTGTGAGDEQRQQAKAMKFSAESDASHTGTTTIQIQAKVGSLWNTMGTLSVTGNSDSDYFLVDGSIGTYRANCSTHGDSTNTVTTRVEW